MQLCFPSLKHQLISPDGGESYEYSTKERIVEWQCTVFNVEKSVVFHKSVSKWCCKPNSTYDCLWKVEAEAQTLIKTWFVTVDVTRPWPWRVFVGERKNFSLLSLKDASMKDLMLFTWIPTQRCFLSWCDRTVSWLLLTLYCFVIIWLNWDIEYLMSIITPLMAFISISCLPALCATSEFFASTAGWN